MTKKIRLLLADDHAILRRGLRKILEAEPDMEVVGEAENGREALRLTKELNPDVVILDVSMPGENGIECLKKIASRNLSRVLMLTVHHEVAFIAAAVSAGASGYLSKESADTELIGAIRTIDGGGSAFSPAATRILASPAPEERRTPSLSSLTKREMEVFHLMAEGKTSRRIAEQLLVTPKTIQTHRRNVLEKVGVRTPGELIRFALREVLAGDNP